MSSRSNIRKRERQKRRHAQRQKQQVDKLITRIKTSDLLEDLARPISARAFDEALQEIHK